VNAGAPKGENAVASPAVLVSAAVNPLRLECRFLAALFVLIEAVF